MAQLTYEQIAARFEGHVARGNMALLESESRQVLAQHRHFLCHMYLIVALLRTGRRDEAARELDDLMSYKFNIAERAFPEIKAAFPEKFGQHFILDTMKTELAFEAAGQIRRPWNIPYPLSEVADFSKAVDELVEEAVPHLVPLERGAPVTTFGSCFAANLARMLKASGVEATNLLIEESINSPLANRAFLSGIAGDAKAPGYRDRLHQTYGDEFLSRARGQLAGAQAIVLTLGVAPAFFRADSGEFAFLEDYRALLKAGKVRMRTPGVEETKVVIREILVLLRALNAKARIYVSISPVPLMGTAELANAVVADCVSKTTLRAALHEVLHEAQPRDVYYWPSFEIVRWLGGHTSLPVFGGDDADSRHVSNWVVALIVERFSRHLFNDGKSS